MKMHALELIVAFQAWATARPELETRLASESLEKKMDAVAAIEAEQGPYGGESPEKFESRATRGGGARTTCGHGARDLFPPHDLRFAHDPLSLAHDLLP